MDATHPVHDAIAGEVDLPADGVVVDLGCGRGATLAAIARRRPGLRLIGLAAADERGDFVYAETTFIAVAHLSFSSPARSS